MFVIVMFKKKKSHLVFWRIYFGGIESSHKNESWFHIKTRAVWVPGTDGTGFGEVFTFHSQMNTRRYLTRKAAFLTKKPPKLVLFFRIGKSYTQNGLQMRSACWIQSVCVCIYIYIYPSLCLCRSLAPSRFSSIALSFPESLLIVLAYMAASSYVHHLVRPWFAPLDRIRVLADGLVQGTSHAYH